MILAPRMIQSMEILQLPIMALQERIEQELQENPVLELREERRRGQPAAEEAAEAAERRAERSGRPGEGTGHRRAGDDERLRPPRSPEPRLGDHFNEEHRPSRNGMDEEGDKKHDAMQNMAVAAAIAAGLPRRPARLPRRTTPDQLRLIRYLITHIDDSGYLARAARRHCPRLRPAAARLPKSRTR